VVRQPLLRVLDPLAMVELLETRMIAGRFVVILTHATIKTVALATVTERSGNDQGKRGRSVRARPSADTPLFHR
jgi:hypothetical protein